MTEQERNLLACELSALSVFRGVLRRAEMAHLLAFLKSHGNACEKMGLLGEFVYSLAPSGYCFSDFLRRAVYEDENAYVRCAARNAPPSPALENNARAELALFSRLTQLNAAALCEDIGHKGYIPQFENHPMDFEAAYAERMANIHRYGFGIFATAGMFRVEDG